MVAFSKVLPLTQHHSLDIRLSLPYNPPTPSPGRKQKHIIRRPDPYILKNRLLYAYAQDSVQEFGLFPFRSPLLRESLLLSIPPGTKMFQFPGCLSSHKCDGCYGFAIAGFPIRKSPDHRLLSATRRLSQTTTSFISFIYQDILRVLFGELLTPANAFALLLLASNMIKEPYLKLCCRRIVFDFSLET
jgi:hypothetical protein